MRILDLFCGAGGAAMGYHQAGFEVVGVDIRPQPNYPFYFVKGDALEVASQLAEDKWVTILEDIDAIHASPPCPRWSSGTIHPFKYEDLITPIRPLLQATGLPYIIENVPMAPLITPTQLCGSSFGLRVRRHRIFETNFPVERLRCMHWWQNEEKPFIIYRNHKWRRSSIVEVAGHRGGAGKGKEFWPWAMGCGETWDDCWMTEGELKDAIPPAYTDYIGRQLLVHLNQERKDDRVVGTSV